MGQLGTENAAEAVDAYNLLGDACEMTEDDYDTLKSDFTKWLNSL